MMMTVCVMFRDIHDNGNNNIHDDNILGNNGNNVFCSYKHCLSRTEVMFGDIHNNPSCYY